LHSFSRISAKNIFKQISLAFGLQTLKSPSSCKYKKKETEAKKKTTNPNKPTKTAG